MSQTPDRLAAPFPTDAVRWHVVALAEDGVHGRVEAHLDAEALRERLDGAVGVSGWSLRYLPWGDGTLFAELTVGEVTKSAPVRTPRGPAEPGAAAAAWSAAAAFFGMRPPLRAGDEAWVELDPDSGEPLHPPEAAGVDTEGTAPEVGASDEAPAAEAHGVIDRLVDRLREEGLGARAAGVVNEFGGYGRTREESRELYARLRRLLVGEGGPA